MTKRAQLEYVKLDVDLFDKPRFQYLISQCDYAGALYLLRLWAAIARADSAVLPIKYAVALGNGFGLNAEKSQAVIDFCISEQLLDSSDGNLTLGRIADDQEAVAIRRDSDVNRKRIQKDSTRIPGGKETEGDRKPYTYTSPLPSTSDLDPEEIVIPAVFGTPETVEAVERWRKYLKSRHRRDFGQLETDALLSKYSTRLPELSADINHSISNGWKTINVKPDSGTGPPKHESFQDRERRERKERIARFAAEDDSDEKRAR